MPPAHQNKGKGRESNNNKVNTGPSDRSIFIIIEQPQTLQMNPTTTNQQAPSNANANASTNANANLLTTGMV